MFLIEIPGGPKIYLILALYFESVATIISGILDFRVVQFI